MCHCSHCSTLHFHFINDNTHPEKDEESDQDL